MSGVHALVEVTPNDYYVRITDCNSKNGTFIDGTRSPGANEWRPIEDGQFIRVGNTFFLLRFEPAQVADFNMPALVGISLAARELRTRLAKLASEALPVLVCGETGTGKEVVSQALHALSNRPGELVAINCAAIPESLAESTLFGHVKGAFSGATGRQGAFRQADRGTLFLDELGDMAMELQAKLLRALEEGTISPVGADRPIAVNVRVIAATNHDLRSDVESGLFRRDLYARLAQLPLQLPTLRSRREDVLLLLQHASSEAVRELTPDLVQALLVYSWPENVRELFSIAQRLRIYGTSPEIWEHLSSGSKKVKIQSDSKDTSAPVTAQSASSPEAVRPTPRPYRLAVPTKEQLEELLRKHRGTVLHMAEEMGCSRRQVQRWMELHDLNVNNFRIQPE